MDRREELRLVFEDTMAFIEENEALKKATQTCMEETKFYGSEVYPELPSLTQDQIYLSMMNQVESVEGASSAENAAFQAMKELQKRTVFVPEREGKVSVTQNKTFEAALKHHENHPEKKIAVLNFASATTPGGGVTKGSKAQEESLCRCSNLYPVLNQKRLHDDYYTVNKKMQDVRHTDAIIYSPKVTICKTDTHLPQRVSEEEFVQVDVITCAAPNLRASIFDASDDGSGKQVHMTKMELFQLHKKRASHILTIAAANHVDILILGAFGCGAFANDPATVAKAYMAAMMQFRNRFDEIEFAIYCRQHETENYDAFAEFLGDM